MSITKTAVSIGKFECLHRGHQKLIANIRAKEKEGLCSTVITIDTGLSRQVLTREEKQSLLKDMGVQQCPWILMDQAFRNMEPETFVKEILVGRFHAAYVTAGEDFRYGRDRRGDGALLKSLGREYGFQVDLEGKEQLRGRQISSSWIRQELEKGNLPLANELLGYPYFLGGQVIQGNHLGRTLGMPTVNLELKPQKLLPPLGVYASVTTVRGTDYAGVTNIGYRPTVEEQEKRLGAETHLFGFSGRLYGEQVKVSLLGFLREERRFADLDSLRLQILKDIEKGKQYFA